MADRQNKSVTALCESVTTPSQRKTEWQNINSPGPGVYTELHSVDDPPSIKTLTSFWSGAMMAVGTEIGMHSRLLSAEPRFGLTALESSRVARGKG